jgi:hypothetical protein
MGLGCGARARGQDELLQPRQLCVVVRERVVELQQGIVLEQLETRNRQLAAEVEQLVLDIDQQLAQVLRQRLAQQQTDVGIEFVDIAHRVRAAAVFRDPGIVAQSRGAVVTRTGGYLCQTIAHGVPCWVAVHGSTGSPRTVSSCAGRVKGQTPCTGKTPFSVTARRKV